MSDSAPPSNERLELLYRLSQTFNSSLDINEVLNNVIDEVILAMRAERGFVMLNDAHGKLEFKVARGIDQQTIKQPNFQISHSIIQQVKEKGDPVMTFDAQSDERFNMQHSIAALGLRSILCVPLKNKEKITGIIYVDNRLQSGIFSKADQDLLSAIASTAAIAIENAALFADLGQSKRELELAYDTTLEGWARALELRDHETEGHTRRVALITDHLARRFGIPEAQIDQIRRGALLHDIGKMGIPDKILLKPGPLTPGEYEIMKMHTVFAYEMLSPIEFLRPAIEIPYCHHEKWDGSGYPRGLRGEQIPFSARVFAVVDVWDALSSVRPYRHSWPDEKIIQYIQGLSGKHFDPEVVQIFMEYLGNQGLIRDQTG